MPAHDFSQALGITIFFLNRQPDFRQLHTCKQFLVLGNFLLNKESSYFLSVRAKLWALGASIL